MALAKAIDRLLQQPCHAILVLPEGAPRLAMEAQAAVHCWGSGGGANRGAAWVRAARGMRQGRVAAEAESIQTVA